MADATAGREMTTRGRILLVLTLFFAASVLFMDWPVFRPIFGAFFLLTSAVGFGQLMGLRRARLLRRPSESAPLASVLMASALALCGLDQLVWDGLMMPGGVLLAVGAGLENWQQHRTKVQRVVV